MSCKSRAIYQNVIEKYQQKLTKKFPKDAIHERLKCRGCIGKVERHNEKFIMTDVSMERCLWNILGLNSNLMIPGLQINFTEDGGTMEFIQ